MSDIPHTTSPHDAAARRRFEQHLSRVLWLHLLADWDEKECFYISADIAYEAHKQAELNPEKRT